MADFRGVLNNVKKEVGKIKLPKRSKTTNSRPAHNKTENRRPTKSRVSEKMSGGFFEERIVERRPERPADKQKNANQRLGFLEFDDPGTKNRIIGVILVFLAMIVIASIVSAFSGHTVQNNALEIPKIANAQPVDGKTAYIEWQSVADADGYEIYTSDTADGEYAFYAKVNSAVTKYVFYNLSPKAYYVKVSATNGMDVGQMSEPVMFTPQETLQAELKTYVSGSDITLILPEAALAQTYEIEKSVNGGEFKSIYNGAARVFSDKDIAENTSYQYRAIIHFLSGKLETAPTEAIRYQNPTRIKETDEDEEESTGSEKTGRTSEEVMKAKKTEKESGMALKIFIDSDSTPKLADLSDYMSPASLPVESIKINAAAESAKTAIVSVAGENYVVRTSPDETAIEQSVEAYINELHSLNDEYSVDHDEALANAAKVRAREIATTFSHKRPDGSGLWTLIDGYEDYDSYLGENILSGAGSAQEIFAAWYNDSAARANLLDPEYDRVGVGVYYAGEGQGLFAVVLFAD